MPLHAGFASVIILKAGTLQQILLAATQAGNVPRHFDGSVQVHQGTVTYNASWHFFVDLPTLTLSSGIPGTVILARQGWGPVSLAGGNAPLEGNARFDARVRCPLGAAFDQTNLQIKLDTDNATVEDLKVTALGNDLPGLDTLLASPEVRNEANAQLLKIVRGTSKALTPAIDLSFVSDVFSTSDKSAKVRTFDAAVAIGIDVQSAVVATSGDVSSITDFSGAQDIAVYSFRALTELRFPEIRTLVANEVAHQGATLDSLDISLQSGHIAVSGRASKNTGAVAFSMNLLPRLTRPEVVEYWPPLDLDRFYPIYRTVHHPELWLEAADVSVDIDRSWWVALLEVFLSGITFGIAAAIIEKFIAAIRSNTTYALDQQGSRAVGIPTTRTITMPGAPNTPIRLTIGQWDVDSEGSLMGMALTVSALAANKPVIRGYRDFEIDELRRASQGFTVEQFPFGISTEDPLLKASWILRRRDLNQVVKADDGPAGSQLTFHFPFPAEPSQEQRFSLSYRLYRPLGANTDELYDTTFDVTVRDRLDRSHPFVRWQHPVHVPQVKEEKDGTRTILPAKVIDRHSDIHRTDFPGRCRMVSHYSWQVKAAVKERRRWGQAADPRDHPGELIYLDELPFPRDELIAHRAELCDYCFFGGPDKTLPRNDLP